MKYRYRTFTSIAILRYIEYRTMTSVGIWINLFGSLFRVRVHGTMRCCGREIFRRLYFILYRKTSWCCNRRVSNVCQPSLLCMCVTLVVRRWSFTTNRAALLCIFSRVSILFWVCGFQAIAPYSNMLNHNLRNAFFWES